MHIEITELVENPDGSADIQMEIGPDVMAILLQEGFITMLKAGLELYKQQSRIDSLTESNDTSE